MGLPDIVGEVVTAAISGLSAVVIAWMRVDLQRQQLREKARCDHVRQLPPGSEVLDLGRRKILVKIGAETSRDTAATMVTNDNAYGRPPPQLSRRQLAEQRRRHENA